MSADGKKNSALEKSMTPDEENQFALYYGAFMKEIKRLWINNAKHVSRVDFKMRKTHHQMMSCGSALWNGLAFVVSPAT